MVHRISFQDESKTPSFSFYFAVLFLSLSLSIFNTYRVLASSGIEQTTASIDILVVDGVA